MNLVNYKKLINPILKYYISDAVNTKEKIIYKVEYDEKSRLNKDDCTNNHDEDYKDISSDVFKVDNREKEVSSKVKVYKVSIKLYIQIFNNMFGNEFDKWLFSRLIDNKKECINTINIVETYLPDKEQSNTTYNMYIKNLSMQIIRYMKGSCYPFVIIPINLKFREGDSHVNTIIIQYSKDYTNILIIIYEPHGSEAPNIHKHIPIPDIFKDVGTFIEGFERLDKLKTKVNVVWGVDKCGIQVVLKDTVGLCRVFNRFWTYVTLQLLKLCKTIDNNCIFTEEMSTLGETMLKEKIEEIKKVDDIKKIDEHDVIATWMYRMIVEYLGNNLNEKKQELLNTIMIYCHSNEYNKTECSVSTENEVVGSLLYNEIFNSQFLNIPKADNYKEVENYINELIRDNSKKDNNEHNNEDYIDKLLSNNYNKPGAKKRKLGEILSMLNNK
jgi:hypothetical protein